jgi:enoyl-CoA hydratase/carnithine racemase
VKVVDTGTERMLAHAEDGVGWVVYNNPARHNAMTYEMQAAVPGILRQFADDPDVRVVVVRGAGDRAFVSGADIAEFAAKRTAIDARAAYDEVLSAAWAAWRGLDKPIIAMIRGFCIGGGLLTAMKADVRIAAAGSEFAVPAARLGLGLSLDSVAELVDIVGPAWAAEMSFSARRLSAAEAFHIGLVNRVVPDAELDHAVRALASTIAGNAPLTVRQLKVALREARRAPTERDVDAVERLVEACYRSNDYLEGQAAFAEKRSPRFRGT